jgi:hypothetical protein
MERGKKSAQFRERVAISLLLLFGKEDFLAGSSFKDFTGIPQAIDSSCMTALKHSFHIHFGQVIRRAHANQVLSRLLVQDSLKGIPSVGLSEDASLFGLGLQTTKAKLFAIIAKSTMSFSLKLDSQSEFILDIRVFFLGVPCVFDLLF